MIEYKISSLFSFSFSLAKGYFSFLTAVRNDDNLLDKASWRILIISFDQAKDYNSSMYIFSG